MKKNTRTSLAGVYKAVVKHNQEIHEYVAPQTVGPLTPYYKALTARIKTMPIPMYFFISVLIVIGIALLFGSRLPLLTSILQRGF